MWVIYAFLCAFFMATVNVFCKFAMRRVDEWTLAWVRLVLCLPFVFLCLFWVKMPKTDVVFWKAVAALLPLEIAALVLYQRAIKISPLSATMPFLTLSPVFAIAVSYLLLGEKIRALGAAGILCIVIGGYLLNIDVVHRGIFEPFKHALRLEGTKLIIIVALIYGVTSSLGKIVIEHSSVFAFAVIYFSVLAAVSTVLFFIRHAVIKRRLPNLNDLAMKGNRTQAWLYLAIGAMFAAAIITHSLAISMTKVAYMISIKRMGLLFSVFYGWLIFKEENIHIRLFGSSVMIAGAILVALA